MSRPEFEHNPVRSENDAGRDDVIPGVCAQCHLNPPDGNEQLRRLSANEKLWLHKHCEEAFIRRRMAEEGIPWSALPGSAAPAQSVETTDANGPSPPPPRTLEIELTRLTKDGGPLTKLISLGPDGTVVSDGSASVMARGTAERVKIADIDELATLIGSLHPSQAIALGALRDGLPDEVRIVTKKKLNGQANTIARTRDEILYRENCQALVLLDFDRGGMPADIAERLESGLWAVLTEVVPGLRHAARLLRASTSAGLFNSDTGESLGGPGGLHGYVIARDGADTERFLTTLHERCWLHGLGWIKLGAAGQILDRSIIDRSVAAPERLVFEAPPILTKPLGQDQESRRPIVYDGEVLDTLAACPSLTAEEQRTVEQLKAAARQRIKPEAERVHEAYVDREAEEIVARTGISKKAAVAQVRSRCRGVLTADVVLPLADKELEGCTVSDVLADPERFNGRVLADPIEGVSYGRTTAIVMLRRSDGYPWIKSFAHGGVSYTLGHGAAPPYSEEALALAFAERHANTLRYVAEWGHWLIWDGTCWRMDGPDRCSRSRASCVARSPHRLAG